VVVSVAGHRRSVTEGILTCVTVRHRRTFTLAKREGGMKVAD
jgi:hypothetical protein